MKRQMFLATAFSAALAVGVAAQTPPQTPPQTPSQERSQAQPVTLTGCVAQADSSATGTSGTAAGTSAAGVQYVLKNATMGSGASGSTAGTSGAAASAIGKSFKLVGSTSDLKDNLNAKVEVRGTIERSSASTGAATGTTPPSGTASDKDMQTLRVTSVKKIADSCQ